MRGAVIVATAVALVVLATELRSGLVEAIAQSGGVAGGLMVLAALGQRLWSGAVVSDARLPGGAGLAFEESRQTYAGLSEEIARFAEEVELRLALIERELFGRSDNGDPGTIE